MTLILLIITVVYLLVIGRLVLGLEKVKDFEMKETLPQTTFSIIIPFRNEADNLHELLRSISELEYPNELYEIIMVDDESEDESQKIIEDTLKAAPYDQSSIGVIKNKRHTKSPKKDAINTAISVARHDWIITTDADCTFNPKWLSVLDSFVQEKKPKMIVAPVTYSDSSSFFQRFQFLDFMSLIGATIGGFGNGKPFLCNGANLAYKKTAFTKVNGFTGNENIASGDDVFLMEKMLNEFPNHVCFLKHQNAIVITRPETSWHGLISQRKRWAAKTSSYANSYSKLVASTVLLMNFSLIAATFMSLFGVISIKAIGYAFLVKFCIDFYLIYKTAQFLDASKALSSYALSSLIYPLFNVYVAITSWYAGYSWKGRTFGK